MFHVEPLPGQKHMATLIRVLLELNWSPIRVHKISIRVLLGFNRSSNRVQYLKQIRAQLGFIFLTNE